MLPRKRYWSASIGNVFFFFSCTDQKQGDKSGGGGGMASQNIDIGND